jgi:hypothetical protein
MRHTTCAVPSFGTEGTSHISQSSELLLSCFNYIENDVTADDVPKDNVRQK